MSSRSHLFSLRFAHALRESISEGYGKNTLLTDLTAGLTVGIIAIPLSMALAIASGVAPQYGLYTAIIGGFIIALSGGSRVSISGPTAAFVVILYPIAQTYGHVGLLLASMMAGVMLLIIAYARLGRLIEYIPESVTAGFTTGIGLVIIVLQVPDFLGVRLQSMPDFFVDKVIAISHLVPAYSVPSLITAVFTLLVMIFWHKVKSPIPPHLPALLFATLLGYGLISAGYSIETIGSRFHYVAADGSLIGGIPPYFPEFRWPWEWAKDADIAFNWHLMAALLPSAFAIAMLAAIESLLCAVVLDGMTGKRHSANSELLGLGLGNLIAPLFGGIAATGAISRSATNVASGGKSPIAGMAHAIVVLVGLLSFARYLSYLPMPAIAALLMAVAWKMADVRSVIKNFSRAPTRDILVLVTCFSLTVLIDMVAAITVGILLASVLFMQELAALTRAKDISDNKKLISKPLPQGWSAFKINGPLFFAAADRVFAELAAEIKQGGGLLLYLDGVPLLDAGGVAAMNKLIVQCEKNGCQISFADWQFQPLKTLARAGIKPIEGVSSFYSTLAEALESLEAKAEAQP